MSAVFMAAARDTAWVIGLYAAAIGLAMLAGGALEWVLGRVAKARRRAS